MGQIGIVCILNINFGHVGLWQNHNQSTPFCYRSLDKTPIHYYIDWLKLHQSFCVKMTEKFQPFHEKPEIFSHFMKWLISMIDCKILNYVHS
jgi:hypothetical protein